MSSHQSVYPIEIAGIYRELPLFEVAEGLRIAVLNILGDTELVQACAHAIADKLPSNSYDVIVTAEAKSIPLAHALSQVTQTPYVVLRKRYRSYMGKTLQAETVSITTGQKQQLYLDEKDIALVKGKNVMLLDDVISTGSTLEGMQKIMRAADGNISKSVAILTEGDQDKWSDIVALGHIPLFTD